MDSQLHEPEHFEISERRLGPDSLAPRFPVGSGAGAVGQLWQPAMAPQAGWAATEKVSKTGKIRRRAEKSYAGDEALTGKLWDAFIVTNRNR